MGCDIHLYKEKLVDGVWITADTWTSWDYGGGDEGIEVDWKSRHIGRNYNLFGLLCKGVRSSHEMSFAPRGIPLNVCSELKSIFCDDDHSYSYLYLFELKELAKVLNDNAITVSGMKNIDELAALENSNPKNWDLLYPYCQGTNAKNYVHFEIEVPASFIMGDGLQKIIDSFDGVDGDNHRVVFWFDN